MMIGKCDLQPHLSGKAFMSPSDPIPGVMRELAPMFEGCAIWAVRAILEADVRIKAPFEAVRAIPEGSSLYCILPTASTRYYAQLVVGLEEGEIETLFPSELDPRVRKDAIGEMANVISGLFVADDQFIARFGYLRPSTPFFSEGAFTARMDWGLKGRVEANGKEMALHFCIRELQETQAPAEWESRIPAELESRVPAEREPGEDAIKREGSPD